MFSLSHLARAVYLLAWSVALCLLLGPSRSPAQNFSVTTGFRGTPALPTIGIPVFSGSGSGSGFGGGVSGFSGGGGSASGSFSTSIVFFNLGNLFPNNGKNMGMPPPTAMLPLNNFGPTATLFGFAGLPPFLGFPSFSDSTGAPWSFLLGFNLGGGVGIGGGVGGFNAGQGGVGGGFAGAAGGVGGFNAGTGGVTGGIGGAGGGVAGFGGGGMGGFAGKGFGGFNGRKPL